MPMAISNADLITEKEKLADFFPKTTDKLYETKGAYLLLPHLTEDKKMRSAKLASSVWMPCCFVRFCARLETVKLHCPRHSTRFA